MKNRREKFVVLIFDTRIRLTQVLPRKQNPFHTKMRHQDRPRFKRLVNMECRSPDRLQNVDQDTFFLRMTFISYTWCIKCLLS